MKDPEVTAAQRREAVVEERIACEVRSMRRALTFRLTQEAERYRTLAEKEALRIILSPADFGPAKVREHLTRAETFKAAAAIAVGAP